MVHVVHTWSWNRKCHTLWGICPSYFQLHFTGNKISDSLHWQWMNVASSLASNEWIPESSIPQGITLAQTTCEGDWKIIISWISGWKPSSSQHPDYKLQGTKDSHPTPMLGSLSKEQTVNTGTTQFISICRYVQDEPVTQTVAKEEMSLLPSSH